MKKRFLAYLLLFIPLVCGACGGNNPPKPTTPKLDSIALSGNYKKSFYQNAEFTYDGLVVTASYNDETTKVVSNYIVTPTNPTETLGQHKITVSYTESEITRDAFYYINVTETPSKVLSSISLNTDSVKLVFTVNEQFTYAGLIVTANYLNETYAIVTPTSVSTPDMTTTGSKTITVSYTEEGVTKTSEYVILVSSNEPATQEDKDNALKALRQAYDGYDVEDYTDTRWKSIVNKFNEASEAIDNATKKDDVARLLEESITFMDSVTKTSDITRGTLFDYKSSDSNYVLDRDSQNYLTISYPGYPGYWKHVGTSTNLHTDIHTNNIFKLTFRNDFAQNIKVCLQLLQSSSEYKSDSGIVDVGPNAEMTITLKYEVDVNKLYFFVDSCNEHNHSGQITILATEFDYEEKSEVLYEPKTITVNKTFTQADLGENTYYTFAEADSATCIERISMIVKVDYNGNSDSGKWFGLQLYTGSTGCGQMSDSQANAQELDDKTGGYYLFNVLLNTKVVTGSKIHTQIAYAADPEHGFNEMTFTLVSYTLHYCTNKLIVSETKTIEDGYIYKNGSGYIDGDKTKGNLTVNIPLSEFESKSRIQKIELGFTSVNTASYAKTQIYISGFTFTDLPTKNNNVLNIAPIMDKGTTTPKSGKMSIYPTGNVTLGSGAISIVCWWASAQDIKVDSITIYSDYVEAPTEVTALEAHPIDSGVVLTWSPSDAASSYDVYKDGAKLGNTTSTFMKVESLVNDTEYSFDVVAKNSSGESEKVNVKGTPKAGATYDTFIESLNTEFERYLGQEKVNKVLLGGNCYIDLANNYRYKTAIDKMKAGQDTVVGYIGGSITVGENASLKDEDKHKKGYAYYSYQWLKNNYDVAGKSQFVNGSISGTGSENAIVRASEDVFSKNPDIVFIECAANNGSTDFYKASYESLIRTALNLPCKPAVILTFSCTYYTSGSSPEFAYMSDIGAYYGLPMYSFNKGFREICTPSESGGVIGDEIYARFSTDGTHPDDDGHQLYAKGLAYFLRCLYNEETDEEISVPAQPSQNRYNKFENMETYTGTNSNEVVKSFGSFVAASTGTPSTKDQSDTTAYTHGWKKTDTSSNNAMTIEVNAKNFVLVYEAGNPSVSGDPKGNIIVSYVNKNDSTDTGSLTWDVSKIVKQSTSGSTEITSQSEDGWENPVAVLIFDKITAGDYTISIQMSENAGICTIMAFGITR